MKFLVVEDHCLVRSGLKMLLAREYPNAEVSEVQDAAAAMKLIGNGAWDVVLLDLELPDRSGLDLIRDIKSVSPRSRILIVSGEDEAEVGGRVLKAGADGFVGKASAASELLNAIRRVASGKKYVSADLAANLVTDVLKDGDSAHDQLSDRELEVLKQFGRGLTASQIAENLGLSVKTVSTYRARILEKINLETTGDLVRYAVKNKLA